MMAENGHKRGKSARSHVRRKFMRYITIDGRTKNLTEWAREIGITKEAMRLRVNKYGENAGKKLLLKKEKQGKIKHTSKYFRKYGKTLKEMAEEAGITTTGMFLRIKKHGVITKKELLLFKKSEERKITINGITKRISEWAEEVGVSAQTIRMREKKYGLNSDKMLCEKFAYQKGLRKHHDDEAQ